MLKMSSRIVGACALSSALAGCTWYTQLAEPTESREARIGKYEAQPKDSYLMRFDELQQRIEALERENHRLRSPKGVRNGRTMQHNNAISAITPHKLPEPDKDLQNSVIEQVKLKVSQAVLAIDNVLSQLAQASSNSGDNQESELVASLETTGSVVKAMESSINSVSGSLGRNAEGDVVRSTTKIPNSPTRFNFSVVYSYPEATPWNNMWRILEDANEKDKWRGVNKETPAYFIYVGAYISERDAMSRQQNLLTVTGEEPLLRKRAINRAIASN